MAELITLPCGLKICYEKKASLACAVGVFVHAGSQNETAKNNGVAHFIEHMTFKGTESRTAFQIADEADMMGASSNAYTSKTVTVYYMTGLEKFAERYIDLLGDMLFCSTYSEENIEKERGVVLEEIHMYDDDGDSLCSDLLSKVYFGKDSPLARPVLGTEKTVKKLTRKDIFDFREKWYRAENMCLSYVGSLEKERVADMVEKYFVSRMPKPLSLFKPFDFAEKETFATFASLKKPFEQATVDIRFPARKFGVGKIYAPYLLGMMLGGGMSSRLFQAVREELGLVYDISAYNTTRMGGGNFDIGFATSPKTAAQAIEEVKKVVETVLQKGFDKNELIKSRNQYETALVLSDESVFDRMKIMGRDYIASGSLTSVQEEVQNLLSVEHADVEEAAHEILSFEKASVCYVGKDIDCNLRELCL